MEQSRKHTFILLLFPIFPSAGHQEAFENLLRTARLVVSREFQRALSPAARSRPLSHAHAWVRVAAGENPNASVAIFLWIEAGPLVSASSSLNTLDDRVLEARTARKVVVVPDGLWAETAVPHGAGHDDAIFVTQYNGMAVDKTPMRKPLLLLRQRSEYGLSDAGELGKFLGTRERARAPSSAYLPQVHANDEVDTRDTTGPPDASFRIGVPSGPSRDDETTREVVTGLHSMPVVRPRRSSNGAFEVRRLSSGPPDPRCDDEDQRDTIEPPPPSPLPEREDPTEPKR